MMQALGDQHSSYMTADQYTQANMPLEQEYEGIGAWADTSGPYVKIVSPMPGSPAESAGIKAGDTIIKVDGEDMTGIPGDLVIRDWVLGPAGSDVTLTFVREGVPDPFDVVVRRAKITIASVNGKMLENGIAYIQISQFAANTRDELRKQLQDLLPQSPKGLIIDLRHNGGGYLDTAVQVTSEFIGEGTVLYEQYGDGSRKTYDVLGSGLAYDIPMVILVNEGTASASEIVSGALQDYGRSPLVGVQTYGKGSVQQWIPLSDNQGAVRITVARWLTPESRQISEIGLTPDYVVELTEEDVNAGRDPQMDKAVELLGGEPLPPAPTPTPTTVP
jgi:carboxyl-terminal processing protease